MKRKEKPPKYKVIGRAQTWCKHTKECVELRTVLYKMKSRTWCSGHTRGEKSLGRKGLSICSGCRKKGEEA